MGQGARHLFDCWPQVAERIRTAKHLALFLDFDGTLVRMRRQPEDIRLSDSARAVLRRLARHSRVTVWIISGRRRADVREKVKVPGVRYLGLHGWENGEGTSSARTAFGLARRVKKLLVERLHQQRGIRIQDKGPVVAVNYRGARQSAVLGARAVVEEVVRRHQPRLRLLEGKKIWEILPREIEGKGAAVLASLAKLGGSPLPIYIGDDTTDESAFAVLSRGLTVRVGARHATRARFELRSPRQVRILLERLEALVEQPPGEKKGSKRKKAKAKKEVIAAFALSSFSSSRSSSAWPC